MQDKLAPIVLFVYNRPDHALKTLQALSKNELATHSILYIFADGPKENADKIALDKIKETRAVIKSRQWCKEVIISEKEKNSGLANSIIAGVTEVIQKHGKVIVLEDDIIVSPFFLEYMNDGLKAYQEEDKVISIHGFNYPIDTKGLPETFFMKGADCWGWATWARGWELFEKNARKLLAEIESRNLRSQFNIADSYPYTQMLKNQIENKIDSWAIRWYASAFLKDKFTLYPKESIVKNIGFDGTGTHEGFIHGDEKNNWNKSRKVSVVCNGKIENSELALRRWKDYHIKNNRGNAEKKKSTINPLREIIAGVYQRLFTTKH